MVDLTLTDQDYKDAAALMSPLFPVAVIKAVAAVESGGGFFTDMRADILALDGPGHFIDGAMPKILFEAQKFHKWTGGKYDRAYPNISSPTWNRALYIGGQGEYSRLNRAMQLDREAALKSASVGMFQILGENYAAAGCHDVEDFWIAMKTGVRAHLLAFVHFCQANHLVQAAYQISQGNGVPFARGYNGPGYAQNHYDTKLVEAYRKYAG